MAAKKHDFSATEIKAGLLVLVSVLVLFGFIAVIGGLRPPAEMQEYHALFRNITGLNLGADVRFGGVKVGRVTEIIPAPEDQSQIRVTAAIAPDTPVNTATVATIEQITLTAEKHLELSTGDPQAALLPDGALVKSVTKTGGLVEMPDLGGVITRVEGLLDDLGLFLGVEEAQELEARGEQEFAKVTRIAADLRKTLDEGTGFVQDLRGVVEEQRPNINEIMEKVKAIEDSVLEVVQDVHAILEENREPLRETLAGVQGSVADVQEVTQNINAVVTAVSSRVETLIASLEDTLSHTGNLSDNARDFLERNRPLVEDVVLDLRESLRYLKDFSRTIAEQPDSVLRGRTPTGRVSP